MKGPTRRSRRRAFALSTLVLWLFAIELLPGLHLAFHDANHTHDGATITVSFDRDDITRDRDHELAHARGQSHAHRERVRSQSTDLSLRAPIHHHDAGGLAHHALAIVAPPPPIITPLPVAPPAIEIEYDTRDSIAMRAALEASARGPPSTRS